MQFPVLVAQWAVGENMPQIGKHSRGAADIAMTHTTNPSRNNAPDPQNYEIDKSQLTLLDELHVLFRSS
jgi:hypothetical protein